jgi:DNA-binding SARP family transcriptional activator/tetratricopeptide (TPR) repeat protein
MAELTMQLLGPPRIEVAGAPLAVDTRKAIALLAVLAVSGRAQSRERLSTLLWPDSDPPRARGALRRTLSVLHKATGGAGLRLEDGSVTLDPDDSWSDVGTIRALVTETHGHDHPASTTCPACIPALERAIGLHAGPLLDGFTLRDSPEFGEWRFLEAEAIQRELTACLDRLIVAHTHTGAFEAAIGATRTRLALDPLHEQAHRQLMALLTWTGRRSEAIRQYRECVAVLQRELRVAPIERTTALHHAIVRGEAPPPPTTRQRIADTSTPGVDAQQPATQGRHLPLVGRAAELAAFRSAHTAAQASGTLVLVRGEPGIGRTRLVGAFASEVRGAGGTALVARGAAAGAADAGDAGLAFGAIADLLRAARRGRAPDPIHPDPELRAEVARLLPDAAPALDVRSLPGLEEPAARTRFVGALVRTLVDALAGPVPGLLAIDDADGLDAGSLLVVRELLRELDHHVCCVVLAWRSGDRSAERRLRQLLTDTGTRAPTSLELRRLTPDEVTRVASEVADHLDADVVSQLVERSEGLPLAVDAELGAVADRAAVAGRPVGTDTVAAPPPGLRAAFLPRVDVLDDVARQVATAAAVIGRRFELATLVHASGRAEDEVLAAIDDLVGRGLLREADPLGETGYDFTHRGIRTVLLDETTAARRRLLHGRVADALARPETGVPADELAAVRAYHLERAGRRAEAAAEHRVAGERAARLHANEDAVRHLEAALATGHPDRRGVATAIGDLRTLLGQYAAALEAYERAAAVAPERAAPIDHRIAQVHLRTGDTESALAHLEVALGAVEVGQDDLRARILIDTGLARLRQGDQDGAVEAAEDALALVEPAGDLVTRAQAHNLLGILARRRGATTVARTHLRASLALADDLDVLGPSVAARNNLALVDLDDGALAAAAAHLRDALSRCAIEGDRHHEAALHNNLADVLHAMGDRDGSLAELRAAVGIFAEVGEPDRHQPEIWKLLDW